MFSRNPKYENCRLCGIEGKLCLSHVYPKFYWEWRKRTGSGYLRDSARPNLRFQDGYKIPMLCLRCEGLFSAAETAFAAELFRPLAQNSITEVKYAAASFYMLVSVLWRCLAIAIDLHEFTQIPDHKASELSAAEAEWRTFLLDGKPLTRFGRLHMFVADFPLNDSPQINLYLTRDIDATPMWTDTKLFAFFIKFGKFLVFAEMSDFDSSYLVNTNINACGGKFIPGQTQIRGSVGPFLLSRAAMYRQLRKKSQMETSARQKEVIRRDVEHLGASFHASELARAQQLDAMWDQSIPRVGVNKPCPCGSGKKYKRCHGARI